MPSYKLYYFNIPGRAEVTRFLFHLAGVEYTDVRIEFSDWPRIKQERSFYKLPVLEVDGKRLTQSLAIARHVAREYGMYGKDNWECALIDGFMESCQDIIEQAVVVSNASDQQQKEKEKEKFRAEVPKSFEELEKLVGGKDSFFVEDRITVADLFFFCTVAVVSQLATNFLNNCPKLEALCAKVEAHPKVAERLKNKTTS